MNDSAKAAKLGLTIFLSLLAIGLIGLSAMLVAVYQFLPERAKSEIRAGRFQKAIEQFTHDDMVNTKTVDTGTFTCTYPGNWSYRHDSVARRSRIMHKFSPPMGPTYVEMYVIPRSDYYNASQTMENILGTLKRMPYFNESNEVGHSWGKENGRGRSIYYPRAHVTMACYRFAASKSSPEVLVVDYHSDKDEASHPGFALIRDTFKLDSAQSAKDKASSGVGADVESDAGSDDNGVSR